MLLRPPGHIGTSFAYMAISKPLRDFMCWTAMRSTVSLSHLRFMALHMGSILDSCMMYVFILSRRRFSISLWFCLKYDVRYKNIVFYTCINVVFLGGKSKCCKAKWEKWSRSKVRNASYFGAVHAVWTCSRELANP